MRGDGLGVRGEGLGMRGEGLGVRGEGKVETQKTTAKFATFQEVNYAEITELESCATK